MSRVKGSFPVVNFLRKRLQVFVSSTYRDLKHERQAAVEAILTAGHIPAGMELFTAGDESQMDVIKQWIDESDVYLLILGGRYGSVEKDTGKSYTQLEYEYAVSNNKPLFACVINESVLENRTNKDSLDDIELENPKELRQFRTDVCSRMVRFWDDYKDIKITIGEALSKFSRNEDLVGWVRPSAEANMPALADEIARLSKENAKLREQVISQNPEPTMLGFTFSELKLILEEKRILTWLKIHSQELLDGKVFGQNYYNEVTEMSRLGFLITPQSGSIMSNIVKISPEGQIFLNRLELEKISNNHLHS